MTAKDYGSGVGRYDDPEGRNFETTIFRQGKLVLDHELQLTQDIVGETEAKLRKRTMPSGWLTGDFLATRGGAFGVSTLFRAGLTSANYVEFYAQKAHVNGWVFPVEYTSLNATRNALTLSAPPTGAGAKRTDLVILEVWRRVLSAAPSTVGKSQTARIWWNGNVKVLSGIDGTQNFDDDILDAALGSETSRRVQIQYRLRVIDGVNLTTYPYGIDDPTAVAHSVPAAAASPDGVATVFTYENQADNEDAGLWRAGDGDPANTLGTVDGYMYAIPLAALFRRNTTAFNRNTNHNGGTVHPTSDRPDGLWGDVVDVKDVVDLRFGVSPVGWNYQEILEKNFQLLLDDELLTEIGTTTIGGGVAGQNLFRADEIGITNAHGGDGTTTGDTPGADFIGEFDAVRRFFSDRPIQETFVIEYLPADGTGGGPNWANNDEITIDPTALPIHPYGAFNWAAYAPADCVFLELVDATFNGEGAGQIKALIEPDHTLDGLGVQPMTSMTLNIGTVPSGVTDEPLHLRIMVSYPAGCGLSKTPIETGVLAVNNPGQMPNSAPIWYEAIVNQDLDRPHRELFLTYRTTASLSRSFSAADSGNTNILIAPERVFAITATQLNGGAYGGSVTIQPDGYTLTLTVDITPGDELTITYKALRPFPQNDEQVTYYSYTHAAQTIRDAFLPSPFGPILRYVSPQLYSLTMGAGSRGEAYPFPYQYVQMPGVYPTSGGTYTGDHEMQIDGLPLKNFTTEGGFAKLPALIPMVANTDQFSLVRTGGDIDSEGRSYYKETSSGYRPNAFAEPLTANLRHRNVLPVLVELSSSTTMGVKGQLVMAVISNWTAALTGAQNNQVAFDATLASNTTSVSLYRIKGNLLNRTI